MSMDELRKLADSLREHAEWARANEWEVPITLSDDLEAAACLIGGAAVGRTHEWARVEERLPEYAGDYLVVLAGTLEMAVLDFDTLPRSWTDGDGVEYAVTHWMPTPLRPEEDKKDG